jgi:acetylornithine deacetylase/succinyl-diaminopimelate desuccinylase-like protein
MSDWRAWLRERREQSVEDLRELVRIPSISALPEHAQDVQRAGEWLAARLTAAGLEGARVLATGGHPVVYAEWLHASGKPTVVLYGHFDVQPVDPLDQWQSPPFEPAVRDGRLYGRGATDDKGPIAAAIAAVEALLRSNGALPVNLKFLLEGQEEIGSPQLPAFLEANGDLFRCDVIVSVDGGRCGDTPPRLVIGTRGLCALEIDVRGAKSDLHSGLYGGAAPNPLQALAHILASLRSPEGTVLVGGFYDDVRPLGGDERALLEVAPVDEAALRERLRVPALVGEAGYSALERMGTRPTLDVNGMWGGFQGEGVKTVIPSAAHAKITCRLVPAQDPERVRRLLIDHVRRHAPPGVTVHVHEDSAALANPYLVPAGHPANRAAYDVTEELTGQRPAFTRLGGTVPVLDLLLKRLGAYSIFFGFGADDEGQHAPNEFLRLDNFARSQIGYARLLERLGELPPEALRA